MGSTVGHVSLEHGQLERDRIVQWQASFRHEIGQPENRKREHVGSLSCEVSCVCLKSVDWDSPVPSAGRGENDGDEACAALGCAFLSVMDSVGP